MPFVRRCPNCGEENSDRARFCQSCGQTLEATGTTASRDVRRVVTVLFSDVTGSTALGERLDPESLRHVMGRFFDVMQEAIERHGGVVEKFIGDAVMAVFGIPRLHEDDPIRAVRAAMDMRDALGRLNAELRAERGITLSIRTGATTGEVVAGDPSAGQRLVTGDTVNTAARLEQSAQPGEILIGESTYRLVRDAVEVETVEPLQLKGKADAIPAHRLLEVRADAAAHSRHFDSAMVGRDRELHLLQEALDRAVSELTCHLFTLLGPAGVGKSRLVLEFLQRVGPTAIVLRGRCLSYGEGITFFPVTEIVREAAGIQDQDPSTEASRKVEALVAGTEHAVLVLAGVAHLMGLQDTPVGVDDTFWAVRTLLETLARHKPLVVVFDDIHWAEPAFLDLIEHIAEWTRDAPIMLLCVARPELLDLRPGWAGGKLNATSILLEPLGDAQSGELIDNLLGSEGLPARARSRILEAAEGNPLFVEEMLAMLVDDGLLRDEDGQWVASDEVARVAVPPTIQLLLAARLDRLDSEERAVAERASVEGKVFHRGAVTELSPDQDRPQVRARLLALTRKELIRPDRAQFAGEDAFRFRHLLIRDAAYHGMPKEARAELHERFADWLTEQASDRLPEYEDILGYHLEQAYRYRTELGPVDEGGRDLQRRAASALAGAAQRGLARDDIHTALGLLRRAIDLTPRESSESRRLRWALADSHQEIGDIAESLQITSDLVEDAQRANDRAIESLARSHRAYLITMTDPSIPQKAALDEAERAMRTLEEMGDQAGVMRVSRTVSFMTFAMGDVDLSVSLARARYQQAKALGDRRETGRAVPAVSGGLYYGATPVPEAVDEILRMLPDIAGSRLSTAEAMVHLPALYAMQGRFDEARRSGSESKSIFLEMGNRWRLATRVFFSGPMFMLAGDFEGAERELRESLTWLEEMGDKGFQSTVLPDLAEALIAQGRSEEAEPLIIRSRAIGGSDDIVTQFAWRKALAAVLASRGEFEEAVRLARDAVALADGTGYLSLRGECHARLGDVLRLAGQKEAAQEAFTLALGLFERKGNEVLAAHVRHELASLTEP
jgi:class 3 adenylate cyclase/tetratricopeptide (TPR) repeat protein